MRSASPTDAFLALLALVLGGIPLSCTYDTGLPLQNDAPECISHSFVQENLFYPESTVCTLRVADLNDKTFDLSLIGKEASALSSDFAWCENGGATYGTKEVYFHMPTSVVGTHSGAICICDHQGTADTVHYSVTKTFRDELDRYPLDAANWEPYSREDSSLLRFDYKDRKLIFVFPPENGDEETAVKSTGIRSQFSVSGNFELKIDFKLRDDMTEGFELAFFVSTSSATGRWDGQVAGFFVSGNEGRVRLTCRSVQFQIQSKDIDFYSGELALSRQNDTLEYFYHDGNPLKDPLSLAVHGFPPDSPLYVHLRMTVDDRSKIRSCAWNNFVASRGELRF